MNSQSLRAKSQSSRHLAGSIPRLIEISGGRVQHPPTVVGSEGGSGVGGEGKANIRVGKDDVNANRRKVLSNILI